VRDAGIESPLIKDAKEPFLLTLAPYCSSLRLYPSHHFSPTTKEKNKHLISILSFLKKNKKFLGTVPNLLKCDVVCWLADCQSAYSANQLLLIFGHSEIKIHHF